MRRREGTHTGRKRERENEVRSCWSGLRREREDAPNAGERRATSNEDARENEKALFQKRTPPVVEHVVRLVTRAREEPGRVSRAPKENLLKCSSEGKGNAERGSFFLRSPASEKNKTAAWITALLSDLLLFIRLLLLFWLKVRCCWFSQLPRFDLFSFFFAHKRSIRVSSRSWTLAGGLE